MKLLLIQSLAVVFSASAGVQAESSSQLRGSNGEGEDALLGCPSGCKWKQTWGGNRWAPPTGYCDCWSGGGSGGGGGSRGGGGRYHHYGGNGGRSVTSNCYGGRNCDMTGCTSDCSCFGGAICNMDDCEENCSFYGGSTGSMSNCKTNCKCYAGSSVDAPNGCRPYAEEEKDEFEAFMAAN